MGTCDATDQDTRSTILGGEGGGAGGGGLRAARWGEGARKVSCWSDRSGKRARRLPRYATRARDVTGPVTRAPCAPDHVFCHALAAPSLPLSRSVSLSPPRPLSRPLVRLSRLAAAPFEWRMREYANSLSRSVSLSRVNRLRFKSHTCSFPPPPSLPPTVSSRSLRDGMRSAIVLRSFTTIPPERQRFHRTSRAPFHCTKEPI